MTRTTPRPALFVVLAALVLGLVAVAPPPSAEASSSAEQDFVQRLNNERTSRGLPALQVASDLRSVARKHSDTMADANWLHHNPSLASDVEHWRRLTENVGRGPSVSSLHSALMNSSGHRANILDRNVTQVGVGVTVRGSQIWVTQVFRNPTAAAVMSGSSITPFPGGFADVDRNSTHGADIERIRKAKITSGCGNNRYCPDQQVTRAEMASFLVRALDLPSVSGNRFRDVSSSNRHRADINALAAAGITLGCNPPNNDRFCPNDSVTRGQMASFLVRGLQLPSTSAKPFRDTSGSPHVHDIDRLAASGVTRGCNPPRNDRYCPREAVSRAQMATFLVRGLRL